MALICNVTDFNGITVGYHKIITFSEYINGVISIEVQSFVSKDTYVEYLRNTLKSNETNTYIFTNFYSVPYDSSFNINKGYEYLKTLSIYSSAVDDDDTVYLDIQKEVNANGEQDTESESDEAGTN